MNTEYIEPTVFCGKSWTDEDGLEWRCDDRRRQCPECKEKQRIPREQTEQERIQRERAERQRIQREQAEQQRKAEKTAAERRLAEQTGLTDVFQTTAEQPIHLITQTATSSQPNGNTNPVRDNSDEIHSLLRKEISEISSTANNGKQPIDVVVSVTERAIAQQQRRQHAVITKNTIEKVIALKSVQSVPTLPSYESNAAIDNDEMDNITRMESLEKQLAEMQRFERESLLTNAETQHMRVMIDETSVEVLQRCTDQVKSTVQQYRNRVLSVRQQRTRERDELEARSAALKERESALQRELDAVRREKTQIDEKLRVMIDEMKPMDQFLSETEKRLTQFSETINQDLQNITSIHSKFRDEWRQRLQKNGQLLEKANSIARSLQREVTALVPEVIAEIDVALEYHTSHLEKLNEDLSRLTSKPLPPKSAVTIRTAIEREIEGKQSEKQSIEKERQEMLSKRAQIIAKYPNAAAAVAAKTSTTPSINTNISASTSASTSSGATSDTDGDLCVICVERSPAMVCIPCGHICVCEECAQSLMKKQPVLCPVCRQSGIQLFKTYRPG